MADELKVQRREGNSGRKWRRHVHKLEAQVLQLEEDEARVNAVYPQVRPHPPPGRRPPA